MILSCNFESLHGILKAMNSRSTFVTKSRELLKKELERRTLKSVLQNIREKPHRVYNNQRKIDYLKTATYITTLKKKIQIILPN